MRCTPQCEQAVEYASAAATRFGHPFVSGSHLVLGLLMVERGAADVLKSVGMTREAAETYLAVHPLRADETQLVHGVSFGKSAIMALDRAEQERKSRSARCRFVGSDHLLLALCQEDAGAAYDLFEAHRVDRARMLRLIVERLAQPGPPGFEKLIDDIETLLDETENWND